MRVPCCFLSQLLTPTSAPSPPLPLQYKLGKVTRTQIGPKGVPYIVTHDGRTIRYPDPHVKVNDTVKIDLETGRMTEYVKLDTGVLVLCTGGRNMGRVGTLVHRGTLRFGCLCRSGRRAVCVWARGLLLTRPPPCPCPLYVHREAHGYRRHCPRQGLDRPPVCHPSDERVCHWLWQEAPCDPPQGQGHPSLHCGGGVFGHGAQCLCLFLRALSHPSSFRPSPLLPSATADWRRRPRLLRKYQFLLPCNVRLHSH